jgi:hypothetical protein
LQQILPAAFVPGRSRLTGAGDLMAMVAFIARFAFRRGCLDTALELWKFAAHSCEDDDSVGILLCAAVPALFAGNGEFIRAMLQTDRSFRGVPVKDIPDWGIALGLLEGGEGLKLEAAKWGCVFGGSDPPDDCPAPLQTALVCLKRRIQPFIEREDVARTVREATRGAADMQGEELRRETCEKWRHFAMDEELFSTLVEEDMFPVNPEA